MTAAEVTAVATMIDPLLPTATAARLEALRPQAQKRRKPAHAAKIFTAGMSTTAMLGLVAVMGWPTGGGVAQGAASAAPLTPDVASPVSPVTLPVPVLPAPTTAAPVVAVVPAVVVAPAVVTEPPTTLPAPVPATVVPIVIPVAVPAAQPQVTKKKKVRVAASNTTTKSSG
jgi:hypothetical protein